MVSRVRAAMVWAMVLGGVVATGHAAGREVLSFDNDWRFHKGDVQGAQNAAFDDAAWRPLNVPHDWAIEGPFAAANPTRGAGGFAPAGVVWYRKSFTLPAGSTGKRVFIDFDGVMQNSDVSINGVLLGHRPYGYVSFQYDMTGHVNMDGKPNVLVVRADTSQQPASRYYAGGGIYRHVRLELKDPVHIDNWGTFVTTPKVAAEAATVHVKATVVNQADVPRDVSLQVDILAPDGLAAASVRTAPQAVPAGKSVDFDQDVPIARPKLWDLDTPEMYQAKAALKAGEAIIDDQTVPFGIRQFEFRAETGFWLNGRNLKLAGVCLHKDAGPLGMAVPGDEWIHRLSVLKQLGANAVRTAHDPPAPEFLDACDQVGMLVMDEMFDCWQTGKNTYDYHLFFDQWNLIDTRDTVRRDRNHPSIILYSAGNEIHDTPRPDRAIPILKALVQVFHENDPTRPVTQGLFRPNLDANGGAYFNGLADLLDVVGTNYRDAELLAAQKQKPTMKIIGTEQGRTLDIWAQVRDNPSHAGHFIWTGVDYLGETVAFPNIGAYSGVVDAVDRPKNEGYQSASWWSTKPVLYMVRAAASGGRGRASGGGGAGRGAGGGALPLNTDPGIPPVGATVPGGTGRGAGGQGGQGAAGAGGADAGLLRGVIAPRNDWTPANLTPHTETVNVYSNCEEVELFLNGTSLGAKPRGQADSVRTWQVEFAPGTLKGIARNKGQEVATQELVTAGPAAKLTFMPSTRKLFADFDSVAHVTIAVTDAKDVPIPLASNTITVTVSGPGLLAALGTGQLVAQDFRAPTKPALNGQLVAYVRATGSTGPITLKASAEGLAPATMTFETGAARPGH
jgi:beta-galactosidase